MSRLWNRAGASSFAAQGEGRQAARGALGIDAVEEGGFHPGVELVAGGQLPQAGAHGLDIIGGCLSARREAQVAGKGCAAGKAGEAEERQPS